MIRFFTCFLLFFLSFATSIAWTSAFSAQGVGRRGNWLAFDDHPWARSGVPGYNEKRRTSDYDLFDGLQADDPSIWMQDKDESTELKDLEFNLISATPSAIVKERTEVVTVWTPSTEVKFPDVPIPPTPQADTVTEDLLLSFTPQAAIVTEDPLPPSTEIFQRESRDGGDEQDSSEQFFYQEGVSPKTRQMSVENDIRSQFVSKDEYDKMRSKKTDSRNTLIRVDQNRLEGSTEKSLSTNKLENYVPEEADYKSVKKSSPTVKKSTRKPNTVAVHKTAPDRDFQVELHAAEMVKRKLFLDNTRPRTNYLAPIDLVGNHRKTLTEDKRTWQFSQQRDIEDVKLVDPTSIFFPLENTVANIENPQVLKTVVRKRPPPLPTPSTTPSVLTTEVVRDVEDVLEAEGDAENENIEEPPSLADLFPTIPPPSPRLGKNLSPQKRVTRLPYHLNELLLSKTNRRGRGREALLPPDYSPLPYGIDYRFYNGPKSLLSKLRFHSESNDHLTTTQKPVVFNVPDLELSDTGKLQEIYRFVGRKPATSTQRSIGLQSTPSSGSKAFASLINFLKSIIGQTTTVSSSFQ